MPMHNNDRNNLLIEIISTIQIENFCSMNNLSIIPIKIVPRGMPMHNLNMNNLLK